MIFAFDYPKKSKKDISRPIEHGDKFNGLDDLPKDQYAWYGPAPPHLNELLDEFDIDYKVLSTQQAVKDKKPFYYLLETQGPPEGWLGTWSSSKNTLLSGISHDALKAVQDKLCKIVLWSANEGYDPFQFKIFDRIHEEIHNLNIDSKRFVFVSANLAVVLNLLTLITSTGLLLFVFIFILGRVSAFLFFLS